MINFGIVSMRIKSSDRRGRWAEIQFVNRKRIILFHVHNGVWIRGR